MSDLLLACSVVFLLRAILPNKSDLAPQQAIAYCSQMWRFVLSFPILNELGLHQVGDPLLRIWDLGLRIWDCGLRIRRLDPLKQKLDEPLVQVIATETRGGDARVAK